MLERALNAELTENVGCEKHDPAGNNSGNVTSSPSHRITFSF
jgi:transposase-like protein